MYKHPNYIMIGSKKNCRVTCHKAVTWTWTCSPAEWSIVNSGHRMLLWRVRQTQSSQGPATNAHTYTPQDQDKGRWHIIDVYFLCIYVCSLRERSAEQASEAGLRRDHSVSEGGHSGLGEDAGNSWEGKGQIWHRDHTCCCYARYIFRKYIYQCFLEMFVLFQNLQVLANIDQSSMYKAPKLKICIVTFLLIISLGPNTAKRKSINSTKCF